MTFDMHYQLRHVTKWLKPRWEFVSYPKCGRTWLRFMMGNLFNDFFELGLDNDDMLELKKKVHYRNLRIPYISMHHDGYVHKRPASETCFHTRRYKGKRVIFLMRDPRDVVVSSFHQLSKRDKLVDDDLGAFIRDDTTGLPRIVAFYNVWMRNIDRTRQHIIIRYEDLKTDTFGEIHRLLSALGMEYIPDEFVQNAIDKAEFKRMQRMEKKGEFTRGRMQPGDPADVQTFKVRKGKVGGYKEECPAEDVEWINDYLRKELDPTTGYVR
ncbi:MAG: sulfotransferase domain-containing protein [Desulfovibrionaceae bacterium]|nr:sulfotransferase domain-containing protein [Desulfovibrionaceae bacterium]